MGLNLLGLLKISLPTGPNPDNWQKKVPPPLAPIAAGLAFGLAASPCTTPVLAVLLGWIAQTRDPVIGIVLLTCFGIGQVLPLFIAGTAAATIDAGTYDINTEGSSFSFSESFTSGDAVNTIGSGVDVTSGVVADMPAFGQTTTQSGGVAGTLAGTITSAGVITLTAGGAGTSATGQFVSELTIN